MAVGGGGVADTEERSPSVARQWNDALLEAVRTDFARPTVHARNLFHASVAMYDAWAAYDDVAATFLLGKTVGEFNCALNSTINTGTPNRDREEAISFAVYRLVTHRFEDSPGHEESQQRFDDLMADLGYDTAVTSTDYVSGGAAELGNYIGQCLIDFGLQDGANEGEAYANTSYQPVNDPLVTDQPGNPDIADLNRWQPLTLDTFIDQGGNVIPFNTPDFLSPEWGQVQSFALSVDDRTTYTRDGFDYQVYFDPGEPPQSLAGPEPEGGYKWNFSLVSIWSSHLDPADGVMIDISPASIGNISTLPQTFAEHTSFYDRLDGGDASAGRTTNPATGGPYATQMVPRADYARVLAEFWADGPDSETPPGHWFVIANEVNDHPDLVRRIGGAGDEVGGLEWDVKLYFALGGAMHDSAIAAWGIKGWYDYIRPISALRAMADRGQSSDNSLPSYDPEGIPLEPGYIELVQTGDDLAGAGDENVGKIKLYAWRGPDFIDDPDTDVAGVGWILAENWWPYQRPSFVTPPFAGYVSGHSTYSRAAAEVLTLFTGDEYFPGGVGEFPITANEFLVFEDGPSVDMTLQWATYRDASDQTSLSRIWGGIHPPADDIPGRIIGEQIGIDAYNRAEEYFSGQ